MRAVSLKRWLGGGERPQGRAEANDTTMLDLDFVRTFSAGPSARCATIATRIKAELLQR
jgi:hypothetical protein